MRWFQGFETAASLQSYVLLFVLRCRCPRWPRIYSALITDCGCMLINGMVPKIKTDRALMLELGKALWSQTSWEMTRDEQGGELAFHYVRQQIRRCTTAFRHPLIWVRRASRSMWDQDEMIMCIDRFTLLSLPRYLMLCHTFTGKSLCMRKLSFWIFWLHPMEVLCVLAGFDGAVQEWLWNWILAVSLSILLPLLLLFMSVSPPNMV